MTVSRMVDGEDVLLGAELRGAEAEGGKAGLMDSPEGEIKRVICSKQRHPVPEGEGEVENAKSRFLEWENTKPTPLLDAVTVGEKLANGEEDQQEEEQLKPSPPSRKQPPKFPRSPKTDDVAEKNRLLEAALKKSVAENEALKAEFEEERSCLLESLERLEVANEQLLAGEENSSMEQLQMELTRLQKHNAVLSQRERELQFQLSTKDMLQKEVQHLQELNEQLLESRLPAETESESGNKMLERIVTLETELAEAMEVNNLYKLQLHTAFADPKADQASHADPSAGGAAPAGDEEIPALRKQVQSLEEELQDIRDRYFVMSIRMAEREAQHEEAMMKARRLQAPIKHFTSSFKW